MKLANPTDSVRRSVTAHNSDPLVVADWLELSALLYDFDDEGVTIHECVSYFLEQQVYDSQEFCNAFFEFVFSEIRARRQILQSQYPITVDENQRLVSAPWVDTPALSFCLLLSVAPFYSGYSEWVHGNYVDQGALFERLTEAALTHWFPEWEVTRTGWCGGGGIALATLLGDMASATIEIVRTEAADVLTGAEKDLGVDIAAVRRFPDGRASLPVIFAQCASGENWITKLATPDTSRWKQLLTLTHSPLKAFSLPFRLDDRDYANS